MKKFWLLQFFANAVLLFAFYEWLGLRDARAWQLSLTFLLGVAILAGTVFLHSRTFHLKPLKFAVLLLIFFLIGWGLQALPIDRWGLWIASTLTHQFRKPVKPDLLIRAFHNLRILLQWVVVPLILLGKKRPLFWVQYAAVLLAAFLFPSWLIHWTPRLNVTPLWLQIASFILRFGVAYCLVVTGFVAFWRFTSAGNPEASQPTTAALP